MAVDPMSQVMTFLSSSSREMVMEEKGERFLRARLDAVGVAHNLLIQRLRKIVTKQELWRQRCCLIHDDAMGNRVYSEMQFQYERCLRGLHSIGNVVTDINYKISIQKNLDSYVNTDVKVRILLPSRIHVRKFPLYYGVAVIEKLVKDLCLED